MSAPFENLTRPFQLPDVAPGQQVFAPGNQPLIVKIQCGRNGPSVKTFNANYSIVTTSYSDKMPTEVVSD